MHRSGSSSRVLEEFFSGVSAAMPQRPSALEMDRLPTYDPMSEVGRRDASRARSAENAVHAIPLVLILCAAVLWFFSAPFPSQPQHHR